MNLSISKQAIHPHIDHRSTVSSSRLLNLSSSSRIFMEMDLDAGLHLELF